MTDLEVWAGDTSGDLFEEGLLDLDKLRRLDDVQDFLQLTQKHHLRGNTTQVTIHAHADTPNRPRSQSLTSF